MAVSGVQAVYTLCPRPRSRPTNKPLGMYACMLLPGKAMAYSVCIEALRYGQTAQMTCPPNNAP